MLQDTLLILLEYVKWCCIVLGGWGVVILLFCISAYIGLMLCAGLIWLVYYVSYGIGLTIHGIKKLYCYCVGRPQPPEYVLHWDPWKNKI